MNKIPESKVLEAVGMKVVLLVLGLWIAGSPAIAESTCRPPTSSRHQSGCDGCEGKPSGESPSKPEGACCITSGAQAEAAVLPEKTSIKTWSWIETTRPGEARSYPPAPEGQAFSSIPAPPPDIPLYLRYEVLLI